jgi:hypothetical protein
MIISRIEIELLDTRTCSDTSITSTMIGAIVHGTTGNDSLMLDFHAHLNVTELATLKALLDTVETRVRAIKGVS